LRLHRLETGREELILKRRQEEKYQESMQERISLIL